MFLSVFHLPCWSKRDILPVVPKHYGFHWTMNVLALSKLIHLCLNLIQNRFRKIIHFDWRGGHAWMSRTRWHGSMVQRPGPYRFPWHPTVLSPVVDQWWSWFDYSADKKHRWRSLSLPQWRSWVEGCLVRGGRCFQWQQCECKWRFVPFYSIRIIIRLNKNTIV